MYGIRISYSYNDKIIADAICNQLENISIRIWIAPSYFLDEESYPKAIIDGIKNSSIIVLIISSYSNNSMWVPREFEQGVNYGKLIIPYKVEEVEPISVDIELCTSIQHWLDTITTPVEKNIQICLNTENYII